MLKNLSENLESNLDRLKDFYMENKSSIEDIVIYGSSITGTNPRDIDILVIFNEKTENYRDLVYNLEKQLDRQKTDVKGKHSKELFDPNFLAGGSIIIEGYSIITEEYLSDKLNLKNFTMFNYNLQNLDKNQKTQFTYALKGRGGNKGTLEKVNGEHLAKGTVLIPIENTEKFKNFLNYWELDYSEYRILKKNVL